MARCAITLEMLIEEQQGHADPETSALPFAPIMRRPARSVSPI